MAIEFPIPLSREAPITASPPVPQQGTTPDTFARVLRELGAEVDRGERLMRFAVSGRGGPMGPAELIALQAGIYRYTELVTLTSKFVDRGANAVRTTLQSGG